MAAPTFTSDYDQFASIYNLHWGKEFSERVQPVIQDLVLRQLPAGARILDLCCGPGHVAASLVCRGFRVTGLDASPPMLACARENAAGTELLQADARHFKLPADFDAALSTFNSLAHIPSLDELRLAFCNVLAALKPGAPFLFDLSSEEAYTSRWRGSFAIVAPDHACIVRPSYEPQSLQGRNDITVFYRGESWRRVDLVIMQRCYTEAELREALAAAGFVHIRAFDGERDLGLKGDAGRMFFLVEKPS